MLYIIIGLYAFIAWLILYQIELRWHPYAKLKCKFGSHKRDPKKYHCKYCGEPKKHPHLKLVKGGKKEFDPTFRF